MSDLRRPVKCEQRLTRQLYARLDGTGTAALDEGGDTSMTLVDNGVGDYTLTFGQQYARTPVVIATPIAAAGDIIVSIGTVSTSAVQILAWDGTDGTTPADADIHIMITGFDADDEI